MRWPHFAGHGSAEEEFSLTNCWCSKCYDHQRTPTPVRWRCFIFSFIRPNGSTIASDGRTETQNDSDAEQQQQPHRHNTNFLSACATSQTTGSLFSSLMLIASNLSEHGKIAHVFVFGLFNYSVP